MPIYKKFDVVFNKIVNIVLFTFIISVLTSCIGREAEYAPAGINPGLYVSKYNNLLRLGPCGMPWNYNRIYYIKFFKKSDDYNEGDFEIDLSAGFPLNVKFGRIHMDYDHKECDINIEVESKNSDGLTVVKKLEINGHYRYDLDSNVAKAPTIDVK